MKTIFVLDTNVVLHDHNAFLHFGENEVVIPLTVIEELDSKKGRMDAVGKSARTFFNFYKSNSQLMKKGVIPLENGGNLRIEPNYNSLEILKNFLFEDDNDNRILSVALNLCKEQLKKQKEDSSTEVNRVVLVTNDGAMFAKALTLKEEFDFGEFFDVELYENDRIKDIDHKHKGFHEVVVPSDVISEIYDSESNMRLASILHYIEDQLFSYDDESEDLRINTSEQKILEELMKHNIYILDFFILKSAENSKSSCIVQLKLEAGVLVLKGLLFSKKPNSFGISARNAQQHMLLELLLNDNIPIVFVSGEAGTGKTLLALFSALQMKKELQKYQTITLARPIVPMGRDVGYLPGELEEKLTPWMAPFYDNLEYLFKSNRTSPEFINTVSDYNLSIQALTYWRGRSLPDQFIIIDEAQNLTRHEIRTILTRVGENSKIVIMGDPKQIDDPYLDETNNGLTYVMEHMKSSARVGVVHMMKSERSEIASLALELL